MLWHNCEWKDDDVALFTASDRLRYGDGVFDTALVIAPKGIIHGERHYNRLMRHAQIMGIDAPLPFSDWENAALEMVERNGIEPGQYALNTIISRGAAAGALGIPEKSDPQIVIRLRPTPKEYPPVNAIISSVRRNEGSPLSQIKSCNYGDETLALKEAQEKGGNEAIMLNNAGNVACATTSNIFAVLDGELVTPPLSDGAMDGIIRRLLIERMGALEKTLTPETLKNAQGIYITNSVAGVRIVTSLDGKDMLHSSVSIDKDFHLERSYGDATGTTS